MRVVTWWVLQRARWRMAQFLRVAKPRSPRQRRRSWSVLASPMPLGHPPLRLNQILTSHREIPQPLMADRQVTLPRGIRRIRNSAVLDLLVDGVGETDRRGEVPGG